MKFARRFLLPAFLLLFAVGAGADPPPQVLIEARFMELDSNEIQDIGGVAFDGTDFLVSEPGHGSDPPMFHRVSEDGVILSSTPQQAVFTEWGHLDLAWCGALFWGSQCLQIHAFMSSCLTYMGYFNGPIDPCRALAYDGTTWFVGGHNQPIYRGNWNYVWGSTPEWITVTPTLAGASGIAVDQQRDCLWITDSVDNLVIKAPKISGQPMLGELPLLHGSFRPRGCCMARTSDLMIYLSVAMVDERGRAPCRIVLYEIDDTAVETTSWSEVKRRF